MLINVNLNIAYITRGFFPIDINKFQINILWEVGTSLILISSRLKNYTVK